MAMLEKAFVHQTAPRAASLPTMLQGIVLCAAIAASLDMGFAMAWWTLEGVSPIRIFQAVASWALGRDAALAGGLATAAFGLVLQFCIMAVIAAAYFTLSRRHVRLRQQPVRWGALYGAAVYVVQHLVIVPYFSAATAPASPRLDWMLACLIVYVTLVGIPCALFARAFVRER